VVLSNSTRDKLVDTNPSPHNYLPTGDAAGVIVIPASQPFPGAGRSQERTTIINRGTLFKTSLFCFMNTGIY
jgi:hypothetical protein